MHPNVHCSIVHGDQDIKITKRSFDRGVDKEDVVHIYNGILLSHKKRRNTAICDNMNGPWEYYAKGSKSVRKKLRTV